MGSDLWLLVLDLSHLGNFVGFEKFFNFDDFFNLGILDDLLFTTIHIYAGNCYYVCLTNWCISKIGCHTYKIFIQGIQCMVQ